MLEHAIAEGVRAAARPRRPPAGPPEPLDEYGELFPSSAERADRQAAAAVQRAIRAAQLTDDELRDHLFAGRTFEHHTALARRLRLVMSSTSGTMCTSTATITAAVMSTRTRTPGTPATTTMPEPH